MAIATHQSSGLLGTFSATCFQLIQNTRSKLSENLRRRAIYRATFDELSALSDRDLSDLGFSRFQIPTVAHEAAYGDQ